MSQRRRQGLEDRARELGCFPDPENYTDQQLRDAIDCEEACIGWERRFNQLPTDAAKRDAIHRLRLSLGGEGREDHPMSQRRVAA